MPRYPGIFAASGGGGAAAATYGLIDFGDGNTTKYYRIADTPLLDLGSGAWAWFIWTKVEENSGTAYQYLLSSGVQPNTPSFVWYLGEASADIAGEQNKFVARIVDDAGVNTAALISTTATGADSVERLVVLQSTGTTVEMWLCPKNGTATRVVNASTNLGAITAPTTWNLGRKSDGDAARYWEEWLGGVGQANVALSQANIEAIAGGTAPATVLGANLENYWSFVGKTIGQNQDGAVGSPTTATYTEASTGILLDAYSGTADGLTTSHTFTADADYALVLSSWEQNLAPTMTFGGVTMNAAQQAGPAASSVTYVRAFWLANADLPAAGTVDVTRSTAAGWNMVWTLKGVDQVAPVRSDAKTSSSATSLAPSLALVAPGSFLASACNWNGNTVPTLSGIDTQRISDNETGQGQSCIAGDSFPASAGTITHTFSGVAARCAALMVELDPVYVANAVTFDGTNDYLTRGADLAGAADSKLWSGSLWFRRAAASGVTERFIRNDPARVAAIIETSGLISINGNNAANTVILTIKSATAITDTNWHHVMWAVDLADTAKRFIYLDGAASLAVTTYTNDTLDFTSTNWGVGAGADGTNKFAGDIAELWVAPGQYIDLSVQANREKFRSATGKPVYTGSDGSRPTGTAPLVLLSGVTTSWHTNDGTGGGFTLNGALTTAGSAP